MRTEFGHPRSVCACDNCRLNCQFMPGYLIPADLERMIPDGSDPFVWAKQNLLASPGALVLKGGQEQRVRTMVPAVNKETGACAHFQNGCCTIHAIAPFGCAFFDCQSQPNDELGRLGLIAVIKAWDEDALYARLWRHLELHNKKQKSPDVLREKMRNSALFKVRVGIDAS